MTDLSDDDRESARAVLRTFPDIAAWRDKTRDPYLPDQPSELSTDDEDWPLFSTSTVAWTGIIAAVDHLDAIKQHVEAKSLFSMAHLTLCRSALIGAAQAVWVLGPPDRGTRIKRSRIVTAHVYARHLQYLKGLQELSDEPHIGTDTVAGLLTQRIADLGHKRQADDQRSDLDTTRMIEEAAQEAFGRSDLTREAVLAWRSTSGAAHGLPWPLFGTPGTVQTKLAGDDGVGHFQSSGSLARIANPFLAAFHIASHGWKLLDDRGSTASATSG